MTEPRLQPAFTLNDGTTLPAIGLGTARRDDAPEPLSAIAAAVEEAARAGYRAFDTAAVYGTEAAVGLGLRASGIPREDIHLTTKLWNEDIRTDRALPALRSSLEALQVEYVDLYLVHWPVMQNLRRAWGELEKARAEGLIRSVGVSNFLPHHLDELASFATVVPAVNQIEIHPWLQQQELRERCDRDGIVVQAYRPLGNRSFLTDPVITSIAERHDRTPAQILLRWYVDSGMAVVPKSVTASRIRENLGAADFRLDPDDIARIDALESGTRFGTHPDHFTF